MVFEFKNGHISSVSWLFTAFVCRRLHNAAWVMQRNLYEVLALNQDATPQQIKEAYYALSRRFHPDLKNNEESGEWTSKFQELNNAYEILGNEKRRKDYDNALSAKDNFIDPSAFRMDRYKMNRVEVEEFVRFRRLYRERMEKRKNQNCSDPFENKWKSDSVNADASSKGQSAFHPFTWQENDPRAHYRRHTNWHLYLKRQRTHRVLRDLNFSLFISWAVFMIVFVLSGTTPNNTHVPGVE